VIIMAETIHRGENGGDIGGSSCGKAAVIFAFVFFLGNLQPHSKVLRRDNSREAE